MNKGTKRETRQGFWSWFSHMLKIFIVIRWLYFTVWNIPFTHSLLIKGGNILNNTPIGNAPQALLAALQGYIGNYHPRVFTFGVSYWAEIQSFSLWFWDALLITIPLLLLGLRLLRKSGTGIWKWISDRVPDIKRAGNRIRGTKQELIRRLPEERHLILHSVISDKEQVIDLGAERSVRLTDHVTVEMKEDQAYLIFADGKRRPIIDSYQDKERDLFVELINVTI